MYNVVIKGEKHTKKNAVIFLKRRRSFLGTRPNKLCILLTATTVIIATAKARKQDIPNDYVTAITAFLVATAVVTTAATQKQKQNDKATSVTTTATASIIPHSVFLPYKNFSIAIEHSKNFPPLAPRGGNS